MFKTAALGAALAMSTASGLAIADVKVDLGNTQRVTQLFTYPNNCSVICFRNWTLEQTVEHYLTQSLQRDGYASGQVTVTTDNGEVFANITGVPDGYDQPLTALLNAGDKAFAGGSKLNTDGKWQYDWYFFLPLGMALENRKSIELLHFPPDYSLTQAQDYLRSATTDRWDQLLQDNGVDKSQTPGYQTIVDIAPIAAPASAGSQLEGTYSYFTDYQTTMVSQMTQGPNGTLPMVAFGSPVRTWIKQQYGATVNVLGLASISPMPGKQVNVLGSNHPSYIWYAADKANYNGDESKADAAGLKVMGQDLSAACWQAAMGKNPTSNASSTLTSCTQQWQVTNKEQTCELFYTSIRNKTPDEAKALCKTSTVTRQLKLLREPAPEIRQAL